MSLSYHSYVIAEPSVTNIHAEAALGVHVLRVQTELRVHAQDKEREQKLGGIQFHCVGGRLEAMVSFR